MSTIIQSSNEEITMWLSEESESEFFCDLVPSPYPILPPSRGAWEYRFILPFSHEYKKMSVKDIKRIVDLLQITSVKGTGKNDNVTKKDYIFAIENFGKKYGGNIIQMSCGIKGKYGFSYRDL